MAVISIKDVHEGMEVDASVKNLQGYTLAKPGTVLTHQHLKAFKAWGVTEVAVRVLNELRPDNQATAEELTSGQDGTENEIDSIFMKNDRDDPVVQELYRLALQCRASDQGA